MDPSLIGDLTVHSTQPGFEPERRDRAMDYVGLECACGGRCFHLSGWPRVASGPGSYFWRSVTRVFREARLAIQDGEPVESPFWLPVFACCDACGRESTLLDAAVVVGRMPPARRSEPRESYRCRVCRRGAVSIAVGQAADAEHAARADFEVLARCERCFRQARVSWSEGGRPTDQEIRLDLLYGRR